MSSSLVALILGQMAFVAFVLWLGAGALRERARRRGDLQVRLLERFASAGELLAFLESEEGRGLRDALAGRRITIARQILGGVQLGIVVLAVGGGLLAAGASQHDADLTVGGAVCLSAGVGLLAAAAVSKSLSRRWRVWSEDATPAVER